MDLSVVAYSNTTSVITRSISVGGTGGGAVALKADGQWHKQTIDARKVKVVGATHFLGVSFSGPKGQPVGKGYELDWLCISANGNC